MTGDVAVVVGTKNLGQFVQRKAQLKGTLRELNTLNCRPREHPITAGRPLRSGQNAEPLVVTKRIGTDSGQAGEFSRAQGTRTHGTSINPGTGSRVKPIFSLN